MASTIPLTLSVEYEICSMEFIRSLSEQLPRDATEPEALLPGDVSLYGNAEMIQRM